MPRKKMRPVSEAETEMLRILWDLGKATVQAVCDALPPKRDITYATVHTLLRRLEEKGYIDHTLKGKANVYFPVVQREKVMKRSVSDFVDRMFGGDPVSLMHFMAQHGKITSRDIDRLKKLLPKK